MKRYIGLLLHRLRSGRYYPAAYFDQLFANCPDPWAFHGNQIPEQRRKLIVGLLEKKRYRHLLEIGCAEGWMTTKLAKISDEVVAVDISSVALERAKRYCVESGNLRFFQVDILNDPLPADDFDCILCAGVLVFIPYEAQKNVCEKITARLQFGGVLLLEHTCEASPGEVAGRAIHTLYRSRPELKQVHHQEVENYAVTMFYKVNP